MKNNAINNIHVQVAGRNRAKFPLRHDVNTTCGFGEIQPTMCRLMTPDTKALCDNESLVRLAPMVAPTFGRLKCKMWHYFVKASDLLDNFSSMLAQEPTAWLDAPFEVTKVPTLPLKLISSMVLFGAKFTLYKRTGGNLNYDPESDDDYTEATTYRVPPADYVEGDALAIWNKFRSGYASANANRPVGSFGGYVGPQWDLNTIFGADWIKDPINPDNTNTYLWQSFSSIPVSNKYVSDFFVPADYRSTDAYDFYDHSPADLSNCDYVITRVIDGDIYYVGVNLSAFGQRIRKVLVGLGYQINFTSDERLSLLPLFAMYKAYWDCLGLTLYNGWETTACRKLLKWIDVKNVTNFEMELLDSGDVDDVHIAQVFKSFIWDLGNMWVTDETDYVSAHIASQAVSPKPDVSSFISINHGELGNPDWTPSIHTEDRRSDSNSVVEGQNSHAYITEITHGQIDCELLKRLYLWTNRNTIAGREIEKILRAQGLGTWVDHQKPRFIGYHEFPLVINDVVSQSDTYDKETGNGSVLGEYGGRGIGYDESEKFHYSTDEFGWWISFMTIAPESGYTQGLNPSLRCVDKMSFYNSEFDALGMEITPKSNVCAAVDWNPLNTNGEDSAAMSAGFGFIPRYSGLKIEPNILNGDFSRRSKRSAYLPFTLDRFIPFCDRLALKNTDNGGLGALVWRVFKIMKPNDLVGAGNFYRYPTRYPWMSAFERIFKQWNDYAEVPAMFFDRLAQGMSLFDAIARNDDHFNVHIICNLIEWSPKLQITDSFGTLPDSTGGKDGNMIKA